uniref:Uncharacterized LOC104265825 n=1 Tax=Ciona intestinalis TaxID=7719 RepID=A0A1W3JDZ4_CIOIN|nr:uncharacterized protein LOC100182971 [Ciona intestinalis]XP_009859010.1 uncharacterized protein LOC104265825 [Ciona intestinalis]|eukprot:XP_002130538.1 uncharacterized protein LOC100182971 [Ciona intestinalis]
MGSCCSRKKDKRNGKERSCLRSFFCCCGRSKRNEAGSSNRPHTLPAEGMVPTYDVTACKRPKIQTETAMTSTTACMMTNFHRNERPTAVQCSSATGPPSSPYYIRLDESRNAENGERIHVNSEPKVVRIRDDDLETSTKM